MSKCYDNTDYDDLGSDIQNTWEQHKSEQYFKDIELPQQERQETLEEVAEKWVFETNGHKWSNNDDTAGDNYGSFIAGAKWQQEKDKKELLFFGEWIFDQFNLNTDIPVSKIIKEYLTIKKLL